MESLQLPAHGSNPDYLYQALNVEKPKKWLDFSVNVNPFGMPPSIESHWKDLVAKISDYPDPHSTQLKNRLAEKEAIAPENILIGNGAAELIFLLASHFREQDILIVDPAFSEYRTACKAYGCRVHSLTLIEDTEWTLTLESILPHLEGKAAVFLCNPNNPTGVRMNKNVLLSIVDAAYERNVTCIIDEAFYDFCLDPYSLVPYIAKYPNLVVLRSFTKMYAIAGIRLGWIAGNADLISQLHMLKPHWSVNAIAEQIGLLCLNEDEFVRNTAIKIARERLRLKAELEQLDFAVSNSETNYYLLKDKRTKDVRQLLTFLMANGIVARHTENFIGLDGIYLRAAVKTDKENDQLLSVLQSWRKTC